MTISVPGRSTLASITAYHNEDGSVTVGAITLEPAEAKRLGRYLVGDGKIEWQRAEMATKIRQFSATLEDSVAVNFWNEVADIIGAGH